uniref:Afadin-and alpha-actinin-binding protein n=1 Tax=Graphocephala atropunctata TaxID=36148 RepID=A0A1B6MKK3_9HEMI
MDARGHLKSYCCVENFEKALQTISEDISVVGLVPITEYDGSNPVPVIVSLVNTVWTLLQHRQQLVDSKRALQLKITVLSESLNHSEEKQKRQEINVLNKKNYLLIEKNMVKLLEQEKCEALVKSNVLVKKVQEQKQQLKSRELRFKFEFQRQSNEIASLQDKLRRILSKEKGDKWKGSVDNSSKAKSSDEHSKLDCVEDMYKKSINRLENNVQSLIKENLELRKLLDNVSSDLSHLLTNSDLSGKNDVFDVK